MLRFSSLPALALLVIAAAAPAAPPKAGTYELVVLPSSSSESAYALIKIDPKGDGKVSGEIVATGPRGQNLTLDDVVIDGDKIRVSFRSGAMRPTFEGMLSQGEKIQGSYGDDNRLSPARLALTDKTSIEAADANRRLPGPPPMEKIQQLNTKALQASQKMARIRTQVQRAQDAEERTKLQKDMQEAQKEAQQAQAEMQAQMPKLFREVVENHADSPAAADAALSLLTRAAANKLTADDAAKFAKIVMKQAEPYGARYEADRAGQLAEMFVSQKPFAKLALDYAKTGEKGLTATSPAEKQARILGVLAAALRASGNASEADMMDARVAKIDAELDKQYLAKVPPFKPEAFAGRKGQSERVVVMELFTGAQCPPCVAADVGFDALEKTYKPTEVALIQYHLHIPGPDPLTNPISEARSKHYKVQGTPTTIFDGKTGAGGGGGMANAQKKYDEYRAIIDEQLEKPAKANINVEANRTGDTINIRAKVGNLEDPDEKKRLRLVLVEESIRYTGGNGLRFHHMVVRDMPGGPDGFALTKKDSEHTATVKLDTLRQGLTQYLDESAEKRPFPKPDRPMAMKNLKVIAFVQEGDNGNILQAAVADLGGEHAAK